MKRVLSSAVEWQSAPSADRDRRAAQATAQISGIVKDSSGGVLPGADVDRHADRHRIQARRRHRRERVVLVSGHSRSVRIASR